MTGTNPDAIEAWAFDAVTFEHLLERLEPYGQVVLLSGDVHYSSGTVMSYWKGNVTTPGALRPVHLQRLQERDAVDDHLRRPGLGLAQQLVRLNIGTERIAWKELADDLVLLPPGASSRTSSR